MFSVESIVKIILTLFFDREMEIVYFFGNLAEEVCKVELTGDIATFKLLSW